MRGAVFFTVVIALVFFFSDNGRSDDIKGKKMIFSGTARMGKDSGVVVFSIELERTLFRLNSVQYTYKVLQLGIRNRSAQALHLSSHKDRIELYVQDRVIPGILDPSSLDPTVWDAIDPDTRKALVYPAVVGPNSEEHVFVFMPSREVTDVPRMFAFVINSMQDLHVLLEPVGP